MSEKIKNLPTHRAYAAFKNGDKTNFKEIGALWPHKSDAGKRGDGFWLKLDLMPTNSEWISIRRIWVDKTGKEAKRLE